MQNLKRFIFGSLILVGSLFVFSCAPLTKAQIKAIDTFATKCDSVAYSPALLFEGLGKERVERGLYFAATLRSPENRVEELNDIHKSALSDQSQAKKFSASIDVMQSYMTALKRLASEKRYSQTGLQIRNCFRDIDSLIYAYNTFIDEENRLPVGAVKVSGKIASTLTEDYLRMRQSKILRDFIISADTLVSKLCSNTVELLKSEALDALMDNEVKGLEANYLSYLRQRGSGGVGVNADRQYLKLLEQIDELKSVRSKSIQAIKSIATAHKKMATSLEKKISFADCYDYLTEAMEQCDELKKDAKKIEAILK